MRQKLGQDQREALLREQMRAIKKELGEDSTSDEVASLKERLEKAGLIFSGMSPDGLLPETVEYPDHPWFIGVQFHPELKSRPFDPHPLFRSFIGAAVEQSRLV